MRNSRMEFGEIYFWTDTIKDWKKLLVQDKYKQIIVDQLKWLIDKKLVAVYGFVIMPNHLHLLWEMLKFNGKEMPHASFNKWTSSRFLKDLKLNHSNVLPYFEERTFERNYRFWQRDALAVSMESISMFEQKLEYIHFNPLHERWNLAEASEKYYWSSAKFYENGEDEFGFLTHYKVRFG